mgnify:CR=1 FL=1
MKNECLDRVGVIFYTGSIFYGRIINNSEDLSEVYYAFVVHTASMYI